MGVSHSCDWCTLVIHLNLCLNPNSTIQGTGRALRMTQTQEVVIRILFWGGSFYGKIGEQNVLAIQSAKM